MKGNFEVKDVDIRVHKENGESVFISKLFKFEKEGFGFIRVFIINGEAWFVTADVGSALQYKDSSSIASKKIGEKNRMVVKSCDLKSKSLLSYSRKGVVTKLSLVNQFGVNEMILGCAFRDAGLVQEWVTKEIIPIVIDTGMNVKIPTSRKELYLEMARLYSKAAEIEEAREAAEAELERMKKESRERSRSNVMVFESADEFTADETRKERIMPIYDKGILIRDVVKRLGEIGFRISESYLRSMLRNFGFFSKDSGYKNWKITSFAESRGYGGKRGYCNSAQSNVKIKSKTVYLTEKGYKWIEDIVKNKREECSKFGIYDD